MVGGGEWGEQEEPQEVLAQVQVGGMEKSRQMEGTSFSDGMDVVNRWGDERGPRVVGSGQPGAKIGVKMGVMPLSSPKQLPGLQ